MTIDLNDVLNAVISLEISKGHLKWKVTDLARQSRIGRERIYYHFGKTKKEILERSFELIAEEFYGLTNTRTEMVRSGNLAESLEQTHSMFLKNPNFGIFYLKWRTTPSPFQHKFLEIERRYQKRLNSLFPGFSEPEMLALRALLHGIATAPFLTTEGVAIAADWVLKMSRSKATESASKSPG